MIFYVFLLVIFPLVGIIAAIVVITKDSIERRHLHRHR
jgi:hypothetical protein